MDVGIFNIFTFVNRLHILFIIIQEPNPPQFLAIPSSRLCKSGEWVKCWVRPQVIVIQGGRHSTYDGWMKGGSLALSSNTSNQVLEKIPNINFWWVVRKWCAYKTRPYYAIRVWEVLLDWGHTRDNGCLHFLTWWDDILFSLKGKVYVGWLKKINDNKNLELRHLFLVWNVWRNIPNQHKFSYRKRCTFSSLKIWI